jgi:lysosomal alpha-mannosidase
MKKFLLLKIIVLGLLDLTTASCPTPYSLCNPGKDNMLNVHIVPHTHDDVGWLKTVDQYYYGSNTKDQQAGVQYILDTVMQELAKDPKRRFVYVELAFFWRWWTEQNDETKQLVRIFVNEGRLEFVNGAWCMNDEGSTYYNDIIDQQTLGFQFILKEFGECARPRVAWQLDPFGHSREQASLFAQFGFDGLFLGRLDYQDDKYRSDTKTREFVWKSSGNLGPAADLFTGILPNIYSPPPGFCFDVECNDDPIMDNPLLEDYNVNEKVENFLVYVKEKQNVYRSDNLIITMGSDFQYSNAHMWFKNLDKLIYHVNQRQNETKVNFFYSTPSCYLYSLYKSNLTWSPKNDDFFPYASKPHGFWTGYFTSRPTFKNYVRHTSNYLQAVRQLSSIAQLNTDSVQQSLFVLDEAMGVAQHHDAVSGTEKQHVARDYAKRLSIGTEKTISIISDAYAKILSYPKGLSSQQLCPLLNISECLPIQHFETFTTIVYNPLARERESWIRLPVTYASYIVKDAYTGSIVDSEVSESYEETKKIPERVADSNYELLFRTILPPLGIKVFNMTKSSKKLKKLLKTSQVFNYKTKTSNFF